MISSLIFFLKIEQQWKLQWFHYILSKFIKWINENKKTSFCEVHYFHPTIKISIWCCEWNISMFFEKIWKHMKNRFYIQFWLIFIWLCFNYISKDYVMKMDLEIKKCQIHKKNETNNFCHIGNFVLFETFLHKHLTWEYGNKKEILLILLPLKKRNKNVFKNKYRWNVLEAFQWVNWGQTERPWKLVYFPDILRNYYLLFIFFIWETKTNCSKRICQIFIQINFYYFQGNNKESRNKSNEQSIHLWKRKRKG